VVPAVGPPFVPASYELIGASAVVLRIVSADPSSDQLLELTSVVEDLLGLSITARHPRSASRVGSFGQCADCARHFATRSKSNAG